MKYMVMIKMNLQIMTYLGAFLVMNIARILILKEGHYKEII